MIFFHIFVPTTSHNAMKYLFFFILLFIGELSVSAQHMFSRQFPFFNQLSSNEIFSIHQDREGYFWIGNTNVWHVMTAIS